MLLIATIGYVGLVLVGDGIGVAVVTGLCGLWANSRRLQRRRLLESAEEEFALRTWIGLTKTELQRLPGTCDGAVLSGAECSVCIEDIKDGQPARVLPTCGHAFHRACIDRWISKNAICPICRTGCLPSKKCQGRSSSLVTA